MKKSGHEGIKNPENLENKGFRAIARERLELSKRVPNTAILLCFRTSWTIRGQFVDNKRGRTSARPLPYII